MVVVLVVLLIITLILDIYSKYEGTWTKPVEQRANYPPGESREPLEVVCRGEPFERIPVSAGSSIDRLRLDHGTNVWRMNTSRTNLTAIEIATLHPHRKMVDRGRWSFLNYSFLETILSRVYRKGGSIVQWTTFGKNVDEIIDLARFV